MLAVREKERLVSLVLGISHTLPGWCAPASHLALTSNDIDIYRADMELETLIFDLDGTISDPFEGISKSVNYALESLELLCGRS